MRIVFVLLLSSFQLVLAAQETSTTPILFEISQKGNDSVSYLFGTMHVSDTTVTDVLDGVFPFVGQCDVFSGELDLTNTEVDMSLAGSMFLTDTTFDDLYSEEEVEQIRTFVTEKLGPTGAMALMMKPMWVSINIVQQEMAIDPSKVIDMRLQLKAEESKLAVEPLETMGEQFNAINGIPLEDQAQALLEFVNDYEKQMGMTDELTGKYVEGDLEGMYAIYNEESFSDQIELSLIDRRNEIMYDRLTEKLESGKSVFCAVGALHLPGEEGLIQRLREGGYDVKRK